MAIDEGSFLNGSGYGESRFFFFTIRIKKNHSLISRKKMKWFKKLENSYSTIINTIEKPFTEFKEENEMVSCSQFCQKLHPFLQKNRPVVSHEVYLRFESYASIFGDQNIEELVHLYKQDKNE